VLAPDHFEFCENAVESARIYAGQPLMRRSAHPTASDDSRRAALPHSSP
jgi:hypothetical protein